MRNLTAFRIAIVAALSCGTAACQPTIAINGAGYQMVKFADPARAKAAIGDEKAGPAIYSNNRQCERDEACKK